MPARVGILLAACTVFMCMWHTQDQWVWHTQDHWTARPSEHLALLERLGQCYKKMRWWWHAKEAYRRAVHLRKVSVLFALMHRTAAQRRPCLGTACVGVVAVATARPSGGGGG